MTCWFWSDLEPRAADQQMAIDHAMLDYAMAEQETVVRCYRWDGDSISFGANEAATRVWDRERIAQFHLPTVRRPTGGRAVWHAADDLTYSVVGPIDQLGTLRVAYRAIHERIAAAFSGLGIPATLAPPPLRLPGLAPGACFDVAVGGELLIGGRKAVGSAQLAQGEALLQHGAIARAERAVALDRFRQGAGGHDGVTVAPDLPDAGQLAAAIGAAWRADAAIDASAELTARLLLMSVKHVDHYRDPAWTWRR